MNNCPHACHCKQRHEKFSQKLIIISYSPTLIVYSWFYKLNFLVLSEGLDVCMWNVCFLEVIFHHFMYMSWICTSWSSLMGMCFRYYRNFAQISIFFIYLEIFLASKALRILNFDAPSSIAFIHTTTDYLLGQKFCFLKNGRGLTGVSKRHISLFRIFDPFCSF